MNEAKPDPARIAGGAGVAAAGLLPLQARTQKAPVDADRSAAQAVLNVNGRDHFLTMTRV